MSQKEVLIASPSILKANRPTLKRSGSQKRVRFELPKCAGLKEILEDAISGKNFAIYEEYLSLISSNCLEDKDLIFLFQECKKCIYIFKPLLKNFVEALVSIDWQNRGEELITEYYSFILDLLVAHNKYVEYVVKKLIDTWKPNSKLDNFIDGEPPEDIKKASNYVHDTIKKLIEVIPWSIDSLLFRIENSFPYYTEATHVVVYYVENIFRLLSYKPEFEEALLELVFKRILLLDANVSKTDIESSHKDKVNGTSDFPLPIVETLDFCMLKIFKYIMKVHSDDSNSSARARNQRSFHNVYKAFYNIVLPSCGTHHIQFILLPLCSYKNNLAELLINLLWNSAKDPNVPVINRQSSINYLMSFLSRANYISLELVKAVLVDMSSWAWHYAQNCDYGRCFQNPLKVHAVFYSMCQAIFYLVSFFVHELTIDKKDLLFLQSLHLSALVTCKLNPLQACSVDIANHFANIMRVHQIVYCHSIIEHNRRRSIPVSYGNEIVNSDELIQSCSLMDEYLLERSGKIVNELYRQISPNSKSWEAKNSRKRTESINTTDDIDDFIIEKKIKFDL